MCSSELLARHEVKLVALQTACQNPTGRDLSDERRARLAELAMERNFFVLEDRVYADTSLGGEPVRPLRELAPAHVIYVNSLSKVVGGGLRAGWVAARGPVRDRIATLKLESDFHSATLIQHIAARWLATGAYDRHVEQAQPFYRERRDALLASLERHLPGEYQADTPRGGHHVWVTLNRPLDERALYTEAARHDVAFTPGGAVTAERRIADVVAAVVLAARSAAARRGREATRARDPRGAAPLAARRRGPYVVGTQSFCQSPPSVRSSSREKRLRNVRRTPSRWVLRAVANTFRPSGVISANRPRASLSQRSRFRRPCRSSRSTSRVRPLR